MQTFSIESSEKFAFRQAKNNKKSTQVINIQRFKTFISKP